MLKQGIYEQVINNEIQNELLKLDDQLIQKEIIDPEEAPHIIAKYVSEIVKKVLKALKKKIMTILHHKLLVQTRCLQL